jgi:dynein heavy chain
MKSTTEKVEGL